MSDRSITAVAAPRAIPHAVLRGIDAAAQRSSVDFDFLLAQARVESGFDPKAANPRSSARGLFQFVEQTWLGTLKRHGARFGLDAIAGAISSNGRRFEIHDEALRAQALGLRENPEIASLMAAALAEDNRAQLAASLGREVDDGELYLAHFLGAGGASRFLHALEGDATQSAAALFPEVARANPAVFFRGGRARSLGEVMDTIRARFGDGAPVVRPAPSPNARASDPQAAPVGPRDVFGIADASVRATGREPLSERIRMSFGLDHDGPARAGTDQVRRAYAKLKAFDL